MTEKITIEVDSRDVLLNHNRSIEAALSRRNSEIARLKEQIEAGEGSEYAKKQYELGYKRGWIDSAGAMMDYTRKAAEYLNESHEAAFKNYLAGDRLLVGGHRVGGDL